MESPQLRLKSQGNMEPPQLRLKSQGNMEPPQLWLKSQGNMKPLQLRLKTAFYDVYELGLGEGHIRLKRGASRFPPVPTPLRRRHIALQLESAMAPNLLPGTIPPPS